MEQEKKLIDFRGLAQDIYNLGTSYHCDNNGSKPERTGLVAFSAGDVKNKLHDILRKYGIEEYKKGKDGSSTGPTVEYIMCRSYLFDCLLDQTKIRLCLAMMCFNADEDK